MTQVLSAPITIFLNITNRCNLGCRHCLASSGGLQENELSTEEWIGLIRRMGELGVWYVTVTGGEPFARPDIFVLLDALQEQRCVLAINTNGTLIDESVAARLAGFRWLKSVNVSLDGSRREIHEALRGPGSFDRAIRGIQNLKRHNLPVNVSSTVSRLNIHDLEEIVSFSQDLGVGGVGLMRLEPVGRAVAEWQALDLTPVETGEVTFRLARLRERYDGFVKSTYLDWLDMYHATPDPDDKAAHLLNCSAAWESCIIQADGTLSPCNFMWHVDCGNIREQDLQEMWLNSSEMQRVRALREKTSEDVADCQGCEYRPVCAAGCRGIAHLVTGDWLARFPGCWVEEYRAHVTEDEVLDKRLGVSDLVLCQS